MSKPVLGMIMGAVLGLRDGLPAWMSLEARPMRAAVVAGSSLKGVVTGLLAGLLASSKRSVLLGINAGLFGFALSTVVALGQPDHYFEIVLSGMLVGGLVGFVALR